MKVTDYITEEIAKRGITKVFGYQGGGISPLIDSIGRSEKIEYVQSYHEQAAGFASDAYGRLTNHVGVCVVTNGPGVTNVISAIANSYCDYVPTVYICGQVKTADMNTFEGTRQNAFQEVNTLSLTQSITKYGVTVTKAEDIIPELNKAFQIAESAPCGPVVIDLPLDIQSANIQIEERNIIISAVGSDEDSELDIKPFIDALKKVKRPVIVAGGGIREGNAYDVFQQLASDLQIPVVRTLEGLDLITEEDFGFSGLYGEVYSNLALFNSDLVIVLGSRLSKRQIGLRKIYAPNARFIQIDANIAEIGHVVESDVNYCCEINTFLAKVNSEISETREVFDFSEWNRQLQDTYKAHANDNEFNLGEALQPVTALKMISGLMPDDAVFTLDVGQNQMWCAQGLQLRKGQRAITSAGLGCMGYSLPAAIGAYFSGYSHVYAFMGDGGSQMNIQELQQIKNRNLPIKIIVFNNNGLGMIQEVQWKFSGQRYYGSKIGYSSPDYENLAKAYGLRYRSIGSNKEITGLKDILNNNDPAIIELKLTGNPMRLLNMYDNLDVYE